VVDGVHIPDNEEGVSGTDGDEFDWAGAFRKLYHCKEVF